MTNRLPAFTLLFVVSLLILSSLAYSVTEVIIYNYKDDFQSYARKVAQLNQEQIQEIDDGRKRSAIQLFALLCKTDGREINFSVLAPLYVVAGPRNCFTLFFSLEESCLNAVASLQKTEGIIYAELDCEVHANGTQSEESGSLSHRFHSWGASRMNMGEYIDYTEKWGDGSASVAVVDSGVFPHSLIQGKLLTSGYDYVDGDEDSTNDLFGHGTNVAGIIADCSADEPVYIYPIRVLNSSGGGKMSNVVNAVQEAKQRGVTVINLSLESTVLSEALDDAILDAVASGIIVVVAAGNGSCNTSEVCPAHLTNPGVIVVGAAEGSDGAYTIASYSNYGSSVDIYSFGTGIDCCSISGGYTGKTGTSMAASHISALCALMHLIHPELPPGQAERRLQSASLGTGSVIVPDSLQMIPTTEGFFLSEVRMNICDSLALPSVALPQTSCEIITYQSTDEQVAAVKDGILQATGYGTAAITVSCKGFEKMTFQITVGDYPDSSFSLPEALEYIDDEAFYGITALSTVSIPAAVSRIGNNVFDGCDSLKWIHIPDTVTSIGENTFSGAIILCLQGSLIYHYAIENGLQYIARN